MDTQYYFKDHEILLLGPMCGQWLIFSHIMDTQYYFKDHVVLLLGPMHYVDVVFQSTMAIDSIPTPIDYVTNDHLGV